MRKIFINEKQERLLKESITPLSNNIVRGVSDGSVYVPMGNTAFANRLLAIGYNESKDDFNDDIENIPIDRVTNEFNKLLNICIKKEQNIRPQLEQLCYNTVVSIFNIPEDTIDIELNLVNQVEPTHIFHIAPDVDEDYEYDSVEVMDSEEGEVSKRKLINILTQGISDYILNKVIKACFSEIFDLDEELPHIYSKILKLNRYILYSKDVVITDNDHHQGGYVEVKLNDEMTVNNITVKAVIFPILLSETIKGLLEIVSSNGLPDDIEVAKKVINKADILPQEPWNMRLGLPLWKRMIGNTEITLSDIPKAFEILVNADCESFNDLFNEITNNTKKGKFIIRNIFDSVHHDSEYNSFLDGMMQKHKEKTIIDEVEFIDENF